MLAQAAPVRRGAQCWQKPPIFILSVWCGFRARALLLPPHRALCVAIATFMTFNDLKIDHSPVIKDVKYHLIFSRVREGWADSAPWPGT